MIIEKFLGLVNTKSARRIPPGALTQADDVYLDDEGGAYLRPGFSQSKVLSGVISGYDTRDLTRHYVFGSSGVQRVYDDLTVDTLDATVITEPVRCVEVGDDIYCAGGFYGIIRDDSVLVLRVPTPTPPDIYVEPVGELFAGTYRIGATYRSSDGREGGLSSVSVVDVLDDEGLVITPPYLSGYEVVLYIAPPHSNVYYYYGTHSHGNVELTMQIQMETLTSPIKEEQIAGVPIPDVETIAYHNARLYGSQYDVNAKQSWLWYSPEYYPHVFNEEYIALPGEIRDMASTQGGLVIATDRELYALTGEGLVMLADYGVPRGYSIARNNEDVAYIWTKRGWCRFPQFANLTKDRVSLEPGEWVSTAYVYRDGIEQAIVTKDTLGSAFNGL